MGFALRGTLLSEISPIPQFHAMKSCKESGDTLSLLNFRDG